MNIPDFLNSAIKNVRSDAKLQMLKRIEAANSGILNSLQGEDGTRIGGLINAIKGQETVVAREGNGKPKAEDKTQKKTEPAEKVIIPDMTPGVQKEDPSERAALDIVQRPGVMC